MKTQYNFFSGFYKFKLQLIFKYKLLISLWTFLLLVIWIGYLPFIPSVLTSGFLSLAISIAIAYLKTTVIDCYTIGGKDYVLYNKDKYLKKIFNIDESSNKYVPEKVNFILEFINDFIKEIELKSPLMKNYFDAFKDIDIDNVYYVFHASASKSEIVKAYKEVCSLDNVESLTSEQLITIISSFKGLISKRFKNSKIDGMTTEQYDFIESINDRFNENGEKIDEIYNKWTSRK